MDLKKELREKGFSLKKKYGQNFLQDRLLLDEIVEKAGVTKEDTVLEIGCGAGALTKELSKYAKRVIGYEIDTSLKPILQQNLIDCENVEIIFKDIMKEGIKNIENKINGSYILVANLPYYITTPIVMMFLENGKNIKSMSIMVQEEVADRFCSQNNSSEYGAITVGINLRGRAEKVIRVPREKFTPIPNVDSAVVKITIERDKFSGVDYNKVRDVVRISFTSRRKMLVNNLINGYKINRELAEEIISLCGFNSTVRAENLSAQDFVNLSKVVGEKLNGR